MKMFCPGPSVMEAWTWTSSLQVECDSCQETRKFKSNQGAYKASLRGTRGHPDKPAETLKD